MRSPPLLAEPGGFGFLQGLGRESRSHRPGPCVNLKSIATASNWKESEQAGTNPPATVGRLPLGSLLREGQVPQLGTARLPAVPQGNSSRELFEELLLDTFLPVYNREQRCLRR